jgi:choline kinase
MVMCSCREAASSCVILASGYGTRLGSLLDGRPKFLLDVYGRPIVSYPIMALRSIGVRRFVVVVPDGWREVFEKTIATHFPELEFEVVSNELVERDNGYSFLLTSSHISDDYFLLSMCDHIYGGEIPAKLLSELGRSRCDVLIAGDPNPPYIDVREATKIRAEGGTVIRVGKRLRKYNYVDAGVFIASRRLYEAARRLERRTWIIKFSDILNEDVRLGYRLRVVDISPSPWTEVDTPQDLNEVVNGRRREVINRLLGDMGEAI